MKKTSKMVEAIKGIFRWIKNFFFCLKYPFWRSTNVWTGDSLGYSYTWYDDIPEGWQKAFGKLLSKDIKRAFLEDKKENPKLKWKDALHWDQIKEKYATLRLYATATKRIQDVLSYYEDISENYCIACGKPTEYESRGYILPFCETCFDETGTAVLYRNAHPAKYSEYKKECRIIPKTKIPEKPPSFFSQEENKNG